ncbi:MAG: outer membrane beta-barrel protein [Mangrovibacterium sp.]
MKQKLVLFLFSLISLPALAQFSPELSFSLSPTLNWMSPGVSEIQRNKTILGYELGVNADLYFDEGARYALATGLHVTSTGGELTFNTDGNFNFAGKTFASGTSIRYRMKYVEIPFGLKMRTNQFVRWSYWGLFGLVSGINVGANADSSDGLLDRSSINKEVKLFNMALNIGLGANYDLGERNSLILGLNYKSGFVDVTNRGMGENTKVNSLVFKLGLLF